MRKIYKILLVFFVMFSVVLIDTGHNDKIQADTSIDTWDGTKDTSWYNSSETEFHITTAEQLAGLTDLVNDVNNNRLTGKTIYLDVDVDLKDYEWVSIGTGSNFQKNFGGTFDGQNHLIYNLNSTNTDPNNPCYGLFGIVGQGGTVKNLGVVDANISSENGATLLAVLSGWVDHGTIQNCFTTGTVTSARTVTGFKLVGGLVGQATGATQVIGCYSTVNVESKKVADVDADTVGGLIGQWENATAGALISDCWFDGTIINQYADGATGGILGANFDFNPGQPGVKIKNCMVTTTDITCVEPDNITWIAAVTEGPVTNCYWPIDNNLEEQYAAVVKLVVDWNAGTASADQTFDQSLCGESITNFKEQELLNELNQNAHSDVQWVNGINHPVFAWDTRNILADYTKVNEAINTIPTDLSMYTEASVKVVTDTVNAVVEGKNITEQTTVDGYATAINTAIAQLEYKDADYTKVEEAINKIPTDLSMYTEASVKVVTDAVNAVVEGKNITEQEVVDGYALSIEDAIKNLEKKPEVIDGNDSDDKNSTIKTPDKGTDTGDNTNLSLLIIALLISSGYVIWSYKAKKHSL